MELRYQIVFRPFGRAKDECSRRPLLRIHAPAALVCPTHRAAGGTGDRQGRRKVEQRRSSCREVPSTDPLRRSKSEVPRHVLCVGAKTAGQDGFGYFRRSCSSLNPRHLCILHIGRNDNFVWNKIGRALASRARRAEAREGFGQSTSWCGGETPRRTSSLKATHHKSTYVLSVPSRSCRSSAS